MQIIILGANPVGASLAENLAGEKNSIILVDSDEQLLDQLREQLDIQTIIGSPAHPEVLARAEPENANMLLAVTDNEEVNMVACFVAEKLFNIPTRICRIHSAGYRKHPELFRHPHRSGEILINPEQLVTDAIVRLLDYPETLQVSEFAEGRVVLAALEVGSNSPLTGQTLNTLPQHCPEGVDGRVAALFRKGLPIIPQGNTQIAAGDEAFFIAAKEHIRPLIRSMHAADPVCHRVFLAGGGNIGMQLAKAIENRFNVTIIEASQARCNFLAGNLSRTLVIHGSATEHDLLKQENASSADAFCALTNDDSVNIMSSMLANRLGVGRTIALVNNPDFVDLAHDNRINVALSPRQFTISSILSHVRRGEVTAVASLRRGAAEVMEIVLHGNTNSANITGKSGTAIVGKSVGELPLPDSATVGTIVRDQQVIVPHRHVVMQDNDHIILFLADKRQVPAVERLFQAEFDHF